jgi:hypothetical protein
MTLAKSYKLKQNLRTAASSGLFGDSVRNARKGWYSGVLLGIEVGIVEGLGKVTSVEVDKVKVASVDV